MASRRKPGQHDPTTCPDVQERCSTEAAVRSVLEVLQQIPLSQRGASEYVNSTLDDLAKSADLMVTDAEEDLDTIFDTVLQARMFRQALLPNKRGTDTTIPTTQDQQRAHVKVLFKAFKCVPDECYCQDAIKRPFKNQVHDNYLVECLCWEMLEACIERSKKDANLVDAWEPGKFKYKRTSDWTFEERFDSLVETIATSKTICKHLFDVKYLLKVVDDPKTNAERVEANRKLNGLKARVMKRGKEAEAEDKRQAKRVKVKEPMDSDDDDFSVKPGRQRRPRMPTTAPGTAGHPVATPTRPSPPYLHPPSAPTNMSMAPPTLYRPHHAQGLPATPLPHPNDVYNISPSRRGTPLGMFGNPRRPPYSPNNGHARMQTPSSMQRNGTQQHSPLYTPPSYATTSDTRFYATPSTPSPRSVSRASSRPAGSVASSDHGSSHSWLSQPVQENYSIHNGYHTAASTVSHDPFVSYSANEDPQWNDSFSSGLNALTDAATTFADNDGFNKTERPNCHMSMSDLLAHEEAQHANRHGGSTESESEDGDFEVEVD
ncbi:hypothetical protein AYL99_00939 [Fonsecaea erecta]|uniref:Uncharacterized protein n=1 Tax=Fonsecaea erecta TaxID=1367422 RepID=A0A178ZZ02_9EURO|nr:hypothetical protein AYL99_00939 [Fonsecaea erecta]OAP64967.1 hypothetical protein AYL99_00939 [Fonsecaea erecta]